MPDLATRREWMAGGTRLFLDAVASLGQSEAAFEAPSELAGWSRKNLVAHVAANADALCNLAHWARTGEPTPMYASKEQRGADIESGGHKPAAELAEWAQRSAERLAERLDDLDKQAWRREVKTAQGRTVPATEVPWMRCREVWVHAVDLGTGVRFDDLPEGFLAQLVDEIVAKRSAQGNGPALELAAADHRWSVEGRGEPVHLQGSLAEVTAYVAGRSCALTQQDGSAAPELPAWL